MLRKRDHHSNTQIPHPDCHLQLVQRLQQRMVGNVKGRAHDLLQRVLFYTVSGERVRLDVVRCARFSVLQ